MNDGIELNWIAMRLFFVLNQKQIKTTIVLYMTKKSMKGILINNIPYGSFGEWLPIRFLSYHWPKPIIGFLKEGKKKREPRAHCLQDTSRVSTTGSPTVVLLVPVPVHTQKSRFRWNVNNIHHGKSGVVSLRSNACSFTHTLKKTRRKKSQKAHNVTHPHYCTS